MYLNATAIGLFLKPAKKIGKTAMEQRLQITFRCAVRV